MPDTPDDLTKKLMKLSPDARARVQDALKASLEREIVAGAELGGGASAAAHSRGILFSRSTSSIRDIEETVIRNAAEMDDEKFSAFASRLSELKKPQ